jgi:polar amino acid transport system substrate-binding protein/glutamate/aspartate transport system substrate-binding protein
MTRWLVGLTAAVLLAQSADAANVLERIRESGVVRLGYRADAEPYSYRDPTGSPAGYVVDVCRQVAARLGSGIRVEYVQVPATQRFEAVRDGAIDMLCDPSTATIRRRELVDFSLPVYLDGAGALSRSGSPVRRFEDFRGKRVGVLAGTTTERVLNGSLTSLGVSAKVVPVQDHRSGMEMLWEDKLDIYFADRGILAARLRKGDRPGFELSKQFFSYETYALALPRDNSAFRLQVDKILAELYRSGQINAIIRKTFGDAPIDDMVKTMFVINALPDQ